MKKFMSFLLAAVTAFSAAFTVFAASGETDTGPAYPPIEAEYPTVIVRGMEFNGLYIDCGTENQRPAVGAIDAGSVIKTIVKAVGSGVINLSLDSAIDVVVDYVYEILKGLSTDENGASVYNVSAPKYPESADNYPNLCEGYTNEYGLARACVESFGPGNTYYVNYDWRLDPFRVADEIDESVNKALESTGKEKVNLICASMGGIMTDAYLTKYGYGKINKCLFMSSTFCGTQAASDLFCGRVEIDPENLYNFVYGALADKKAAGLLIKAVNFFGGFKAIAGLAGYIIKNYKEEVYERVLRPVFGHTLPFWGLTEKADYETAVEYILGGRTEKNAAFLEKADALRKMMDGGEALFKNMLRDGVGIAVVSNYGSPLIPVYENADFNGDGTLETYQTSGRATVAKYGETLGDDYVPENPKYLSPDRAVDLSTAILPEYTYIIKGAPHVSCSYGAEYCDFAIWLLSFKGDFYAGVNERYPQFMLSDKEQTLKAF